MRRLLVLLALVHTGLAMAKPAYNPEADSRNFLKLGYVWCDAVVLAQRWGNTPYEAKIRGGMLLSGLRQSRLDRLLGRARKRAIRRGELCALTDTDFSLYEVEHLARAWGLSVDEAKVAVERKVTLGQQESLWEELSLIEMGVDDYNMLMDDDYNYDDTPPSTIPAGFTYCDAELLSALWRGPMDQVKEAMQNKVAIGSTDSLQMDLAIARDAAPEQVCAFYQSEFTYSDAMTLSELWQTDIAQTKNLVEGKLFNGQSEEIRALLGRPTRR